VTPSRRRRGTRGKNLFNLVVWGGDQYVRRGVCARAFWLAEIGKQVGGGISRKRVPNFWGGVSLLDRSRSLGGPNSENEKDWGKISFRRRQKVVSRGSGRNGGRFSSPVYPLGSGTARLGKVQNGRFHRDLSKGCQGREVQVGGKTSLDPPFKN